MNWEEKDEAYGLDENGAPRRGYTRRYVPGEWEELSDQDVINERGIQRLHDNTNRHHPNRVVDKRRFGL